MTRFIQIVLQFFLTTARIALSNKATANDDLQEGVPGELPSPISTRPGNNPSRVDMISATLYGE